MTFCLFAFLISAQENTPEVTQATGGKLTVTYAVNKPSKEAYYAVYITNSTGALVNTLSYRYWNTEDYPSQLTTFWSKIGSTWSVANFKHVGTDGSSGATISSAEPAKTVYWGKSPTMATSVAALPDGEYKVNFEFVIYNNIRTYTSAIFTKGPVAVNPTVSPAISTFSGISISWVPASTGIKNVELSKLYSVYPNPTKSTAYITGFDIKSIEILTINGLSIFTTNEQKINLTNLPKGVYLAKLTTAVGTFIKKIEKE